MFLGVIMIVEIMIAGLTVIFVSSLNFANTQIKRQRQWDKEDEDDFPNLRPFLNIAIGTMCPLCGRQAERDNGLRHPKVCSPKDKCDVDVPHIHVECTWCNGKWKMRTKDYSKKKEDPNVVSKS
jgi:hypothetical protein